MTGSIDQQHDINFRIQAVKVDDFTRNSKCLPRGGHSSGNWNGGSGVSGGGYGLTNQPVWSRSGGSSESRNSETNNQKRDVNPIIFRD